MTSEARARWRTSELAGVAAEHAGEWCPVLVRFPRPMRPIVKLLHLPRKGERLEFGGIPYRVQRVEWISHFDRSDAHRIEVRGMLIHAWYALHLSPEPN